MGFHTVHYAADPTWVWACVAIAAVLGAAEAAIDIRAWLRRRRNK